MTTADVRVRYINTGAEMSACSRYRFTLWRVWDEFLPHVAFVGLNPSTADATEDDPTIRRCRRFAISHGFGRFTMLNLWAFRSTDPNKLPGVVYPEENENLEAIACVIAGVARVVAVWGAHPMAAWRSRAVLALSPRWWCLGKTKDGMPRHPLYLPNTAQMQEYP